MQLRFLFALLVSAVLGPGAPGAGESLRDAPPEYIAHLRTAVTLFGDRDFPGTIAALDEAEKLRAPNSLTLNTRGAVLIEQRDFEKGAELCRQALALDPEHYPARFNLAEIPLMQGQYREARARFQKILDDHPTDELVKFRILMTWLLEKNDTEARRALDSIPFPSKTAAYYYGNAAWEFAHGKPEEAEKWMMRGNWVFNPRMTQNFSDPLREVGWLKGPAPVAAMLPDQKVPTAITNTSQLELTAPAPAAPLIPAKK
jgi:tetratricopeptide (TPR) repeat protein